jgi:UDP-glucose:(heptosyl)LPS alpha-1,3-glucosyltransferase
MPDLYAAADVFLLPALYDPFANVTLEAMAAGLPIITTQANGASQAISSGENGFVVGGARDIASMSAHARLLLEPATRKRIGENARATAKLWPFEKNASETEVLIQVAAGNPFPTREKNFIGK